MTESVILNPTSRVPKLIDLFYSLAIVTGLKLIAEKAMSPHHPEWKLFVPIAIAAFAIAIGDWLVYQTYISIHDYKSGFRLLLDLALSP